MSTVTRPRGPLPARVYWVRRILVLVVAFTLVFVLAKVLGGSSDGSEDATATQSSAESQSTGPDEVPSSGGITSTATGKGSVPTGKAGGNGSQNVLAEPEGPCEDDDILTRAWVKDARAGGEVAFWVSLQTRESEACTWKLSPKSLAVKITSGSDDVWSSQQCPKAVPTQDLVLRSTKKELVQLTWSGGRPDDYCQRIVAWAEPGWYHIETAAMAGEPSDLQFKLRGPKDIVITESPKPSPKPTKRPSPSPKASPDASGQPFPGASTPHESTPTRESLGGPVDGAVEPD